MLPAAGFKSPALRQLPIAKRARAVCAAARRGRQQCLRCRCPRCRRCPPPPPSPPPRPQWSRRRGRRRRSGLLSWRPLRWAVLRQRPMSAKRPPRTRTCRSSRHSGSGGGCGDSTARLHAGPDTATTDTEQLRAPSVREGKITHGESGGKQPVRCYASPCARSRSPWSPPRGA